MGAVLRGSIVLNRVLLLGIALPFIANFTAGAIAGVSEILTFYPLGGLFFFFFVCCFERKGLII